MGLGTKLTNEYDGVRGSDEGRENLNTNQQTLIKKNFLIYKEISEGSSCKVIYEEGLPNKYMRKCANF